MSSQPLAPSRGDAPPSVSPSPASLYPDASARQRRRRISEKAISILRIGGSKPSRSNSGEGGSETASIASGRSDVTPRESFDVRPSFERRPLSYQPRIKTPSSTGLGAAASRETLSHPPHPRTALRPPQSAQAESSLHARLQALLHDEPGSLGPTRAADAPETRLDIEPDQGLRIAATSNDGVASSKTAVRRSDGARSARQSDTVDSTAATATAGGKPAGLKQHRSTAFPDAGSLSHTEIPSIQSTLPAPHKGAKKRKAFRGAVPSVPSLAPSATLATTPSSLALSDPFESVVSPASSKPSSGPSRSSSLGLQGSEKGSPVVGETASEVLATPQKLQRPSIKVRIVTWNMHDSLPKGDLEVLLGRTGVYVPPEEGWDIAVDSESDDAEPEADGAAAPPLVVATDGSDDHGTGPAGAGPKWKTNRQRGQYVVGQESTPRGDRIPPLPHDSEHPYHLLVIAGQECPWGDGKKLATGVGLANELGDMGKQRARAAKEKEREAKEKEKEAKERGDKKGKDKDDDAAAAPNTSTQTPDEGGEGTGGQQQEASGFPFHAPAAAPSQPFSPSTPMASPLIGSSAHVPPTPGGAPPTPGLSASLADGVGERSSGSAANSIAGAWTSLGGKGWSDMCEDWFCKGPSAHGKEKDRNLLSGALLARALSHSPSKRELLNERRHTMGVAGAPSLPSTPDLSRAASPEPVWSVPSTPGPSTPQMQAADFQGVSASAAALSPRTAWRHKKDVPKLRLKVDGLAAAKKGGDGVIQSPDEAASAVLRPKSPLSMPAPDAAKASGSAEQSVGASTSALAASAAGTQPSTNLLSVPLPQSFNRQSSSGSLAKGQDAGSSSSVEAARPMPSPSSRPLPLRSPSPAIYPAEAIRSGSDDAGPGFLAAPVFPSKSPSSERLAALAKQHGVPPLSSEVPVMPDGTPKLLGPYELVIKERMMGCYMAVYVWRGCRDRIRGASRSHVKSGLLAGRVGNKGGVGISVKLGTARLLFVNAHLAAHEGRVATRLADVAKIKAALKVNSFLPLGDPRSKLDDITEQFDHCFWFGDLNFRIDISRQHADWLLMNKRYDQALAFDQLGKVLKEGTAFTGFAEAPIDFPPTYKYDVLKTLKPRRRKTVTERILHRRTGSKGGGEVFAPLPESLAEPARNKLQAAAAEGAPTCDPTSTEAEVAADHSAQEEAAPASAAFVDATAGERGAPSIASDGKLASSTLSPPLPSKPVRRASRGPKNTQAKAPAQAQAQDVGVLTDDDTSSISSSAWDSVGSSSGIATNFLAGEGAELYSQQTTLSEAEKEAEYQRTVEENTQAAQGRKLFSQGAAIKAKFRLIDLVKSATGQKSANATDGAWDQHDGVHTNRRRANSRGGHPADPKPARYQLAESMAISESTRSIRSASAPSRLGSSGSGLSRISHSPSKSPATASEPGTTPQLSTSTSSAATTSAEKRNLNRTTSQSTQLSRSTSTAHSMVSDPASSIREQPYDTSAKQRVPSWCDRVLFRSTVPVEDDSDDDDDDSGGGSGSGARNKDSHEGLGSRFGTALSNALLVPLRQAAERRHASRQASTASALISAAATSSSITFAEPELAAKPSEASLRVPLRVRAQSHVEQSRSVSDVSTGPEKAKSSQQLLHRILHPKRPASKKLKPSRTIEAPSGTMLHADRPSALGIHMSKAISAVDLPSQMRERERQFDLPSPGSHLGLSSVPLPGSVAEPATPSASATDWVPTTPQTARPSALRVFASVATPRGGRPGSSHSVEIPLPREARPSVISKLSWKSSPTSEAHEGVTMWQSSPTGSRPSSPKLGGSPRASPAQLRRSGSQRRFNGRRAGSEASVARPSTPHRHWHLPSPLTTLSRHAHPTGPAEAGEDVDKAAQHLAVPTDEASSMPTSGHSRLSGSWWMDHLSQHLPSFLTPALTALRSGNEHGRDDEDDGSGRRSKEAQRVELVGPRKGRIECLLYKSLDDREMRILEGRSDHRPVIFVGAIGI